MHRIDFGNGIVAPNGSDPNAMLERMAIPHDLSGLAIADIGTRDGGMAFEFERRGAASVVATDILPPDHFNFEFARTCLKSKVKHLHADLYQLPFFDLPKFDVVNYSGVIYHVSDPILSLMALRSICKPNGVIIVESAVLDGGMYQQHGSAATVPLGDEHRALLGAGNLAQYLPAGNVNSWVPSIGALEALCNDAGLTIVAKNAWAKRCVLTTRNEGHARFPSFYEQAPVATLLGTLATPLS
jgi:SAM-dependent methyltransferase